MKNKSRLAFEQLEIEMQVLSKEEEFCIVGSTGSIYEPPGGSTNGPYDTGYYYRSGGMSSGPTDCFFQCLGYASTMLGGSNDSAYYSAAYDFYYGGAANGVSVSLADAFANNFFVEQNINTSVPGNLANFANGSSGVLIGTYATSDSLHAVIITGISNTGVATFYDPQLNRTGQKNISQLGHYLALTGTCD